MDGGGNGGVTSKNETKKLLRFALFVHPHLKFESGRSILQGHVFAGVVIRSNNALDHAPSIVDLPFDFRPSLPEIRTTPRWNTDSQSIHYKIRKLRLSDTQYAGRMQHKNAQKQSMNLRKTAAW